MRLPFPDNSVQEFERCLAVHRTGVPKIPGVFPIDELRAGTIPGLRREGLPLGSMFDHFRLLETIRCFRILHYLAFRGLQSFEEVLAESAAPVISTRLAAGFKLM